MFTNLGRPRWDRRWSLRRHHGFSKSFLICLMLKEGKMVCRYPFNQLAMVRKVRFVTELAFTENVSL